MIALAISWKIFIIWTVLRTMKLSKSLPFYKTRLKFDRSSYDTYCGYFISFKIYLKGISYLSERKGTVFGQKKDNKIVLNREIDLIV